GMLEFGMTCHSGGTLEIYVEPYLPKPLLVLVGHGPVVETLATLGHAADFTVSTLSADGLPAALEQLSVTERASIVVATHADADEGAASRRAEAGAGRHGAAGARPRGGGVPGGAEGGRGGAGAPRPPEAPRRPRHGRRHATGDRRQHPRRDHPAPPQPEACRR